MLRQAINPVQQWHLSCPDSPVSVLLNISGRELHEADVAGTIGHLLAESGTPPESIVLEITESVLMQQTESVLAKLQDLKKLGIQLAIDDFGTGYSSLSYLQRFPFDILKIAKPFVDDVAAE